MKRTLKILVITIAILWGTLLSSALAQVAQFITSRDDARDAAFPTHTQPIRMLTKKRAS